MIFLTNIKMPVFEDFGTRSLSWDLLIDQHRNWGMQESCRGRAISTEVGTRSAHAITVLHIDQEK